MKIEGLPSGVKPLRFDRPKSGEKYINDDGEICEARYDFEGIKRLIVDIAELSYAERQAAWVKENDLKVGDKVKVLRKPTEKESSDWLEISELEWTPDMDKLLSSTLELRCIDDVSVQLKGGFWFPYFVLEKITPTTRPMTRDEFLKAWRERGWCPIVCDDGQSGAKGVKEINGDKVYIGRHDDFFTLGTFVCSRYRFLSDNTPLTVTE